LILITACVHIHLLSPDNNHTVPARSSSSHGRTMLHKTARITQLHWQLQLTPPLRLPQR